MGHAKLSMLRSRQPSSNLTQVFGLSVASDRSSRGFGARQSTKTRQ